MLGGPPPPPRRHKTKAAPAQAWRRGPGDAWPPEDRSPFSTVTGQNQGQSEPRRSLNIYICVCVCVCVYRKNRTATSPCPAAPPAPFSKNNQEKKFIKISCRNSLKFTVACRALHPLAAPAPRRRHPPGTWAQTPPCPRRTHRQTDRRQDGAAAAPSLNREETQ